MMMTFDNQPATLGMFDSTPNWLNKVKKAQRIYCDCFRVWEFQVVNVSGCKKKIYLFFLLPSL